MVIDEASRETFVVWLKNRIYNNYTSSLIALRDTSTWGKVFLAVTVTEIIVVIAGGLTTIIANCIKPRPSYSLFFFTALTLFTALSILYFAFDAMIQENEFQLVACIFCHFILLSRIGYQLYEGVMYMINENFDTLELFGHVLFTIIPSLVVSLCQIVLTIIAVPAFKSFGWKIFRIVGSNPRLIGCYRLYSIYVTIMKVDVLFMLSLLLMGIFFIKIDYWYSYFGFGASFILSLLAASISIYIGCRRESYLVQILFLLFSLAMPGYVIYKLNEIWTTEERIQFPQNTTMNMDEIRIVLTWLATMALLWRTILVVTGVAICFNFKKGLAIIFEKVQVVQQRMAADPTAIENFLI